jgi:phage-related protein
MPAIEHQELGNPGLPGSFIYQSLHTPHEFTLPCWFYGNTDLDLRAQLRNIVYQMSPDRGTGRIRIQSPIGDQREIWCRYSDGLNLDESPGNAGITSQKAAILFRAFDPYYYDVNPSSQTWTTVNAPVFFPIFPLRLTSTAVAVSATVTNLGDVPTFPVFQVTGPATNITLANQTTGFSMNFGSLVLTAGQTLTVDTRPGAKTTTLQDGTNVFSYLSTTSALWQLVLGGNQVQLQAAGTDLTHSSLTMTYWQRYLAP